MSTTIPGPANLPNTPSRSSSRRFGRHAAVGLPGQTSRAPCYRKAREAVQKPNPLRRRSARSRPPQRDAKTDRQQGRGERAFPVPVADRESYVRLEERELGWTKTVGQTLIRNWAERARAQTRNRKMFRRELGATDGRAVPMADGNGRSGTTGQLGTYERLLEEVLDILGQRERQASLASLSRGTIEIYWQIGERIAFHEGCLKNRSRFYCHVVRRLAAHLTAEFGDGYSESSLRAMRQFYDNTRYALSPDSLSWSQFLALCRSESEHTRCRPSAPPSAAC